MQATSAHIFPALIFDVGREMKRRVRINFLRRATFNSSLANESVRLAKRTNV
jgi:hypothetical protein